MAHEDFSVEHRRLARVICWAGLAVGLVYTVFAVLSILADPPWGPVRDPLANPFTAIASIILIPTAALLIACMAAVHVYAPRAMKGYSLLALVFMGLAMGVTSINSFMFFTVQTQHAMMAGSPWPSVVYPANGPVIIGELDYMAWSWFFGLSMIVAAPVFRDGKLEKTIRALMLATGGFPVAGWLLMTFIPAARVPALIMQATGWGFLILIVIFLFARLFDKTKPVEQSGG